MSRILFCLSCAPYMTSYNSDEMHELILASTAYGHSASVLFKDDAIFQLIKEQKPLSGMKNTAKRIKGFRMFDVEPLYVCGKSIEQRDVAMENLIDELIVATPDQQKIIMQDADIMINL